MLIQEQVARYLMQRGYIDARAIVDGDIRVIDASQRNCNFKVTSETNPHYFLKQPLQPGYEYMIRREAAIYQVLQSMDGCGVCQDQLPRYYEYDIARDVLILESLQDAEDLAQFQRRTRRFPIRIAATMGKTLASLHRLPLTDGGAIGDSLRQDSSPPWIMSIDVPSLEMIENASTANIQLITAIQQVPGFSSALSILRRDYEISTLIHGDIRWTNWLVVPDGDRKRALKLVDWENSGVGDPCWDVGSVLSDYLAIWIRSIPITDAGDPRQHLKLARVPLERFQPAIFAFWSSYVSNMHLTEAEAGAALLKSTRFGAARLIQGAFEEHQNSTELDGNGMALLQVSMNMLERPEAAAVHLLGLERPVNGWR